MVAGRRVGSSDGPPIVVGTRAGVVRPDRPVVRLVGGVLAGFVGLDVLAQRRRMRVGLVAAGVQERVSAAVGTVGEPTSTAGEFTSIRLFA